MAGLPLSDIVQGVYRGGRSEVGWLMSRRDSGQALVPSRLLFRSAYLVYDGINARISEFNSTSIQGLLQDDLQKDFCPYYLEKVCRLFVVEV